MEEDKNGKLEIEQNDQKKIKTNSEPQNNLAINPYKFPE